MNVNEFAEQIVFGKTLEDKLLVPGKLSHGPNLRAPNVASILTPGRPGGLQMQHDTGSNLKPPSDDCLENEQARGQLLHFLANHELLATELMALVLLKFPDAPHAFRQGVLVTLQEEQEHTRMYIRRMKECGVEFGRYPLSGQFWRIVEPMQSPMDFVSRLSLTFEQANLDYSLHFAKVFRKIGDAETADVLQKIYEDEIGHVHHGLQWFRKWKDPEQTDWEAYQHSLDFPMSPQRARGPRGEFNREGRIQAGLTEDFVNAIEVFRKSRGRATTVRWFDPGAEAELAGEFSNRQHEQPTCVMDQLSKDLEYVLLAVAKLDDILLVRQSPGLQFRKQFIDAGFELPEFVKFEDQMKLLDRKLHDLSPWAWTPKNHEIVKPLVEIVRHSPTAWREEHRELFQKSWAVERLRTWLEEGNSQSELPAGNGGQLDFLCHLECAGVSVINVEQVQQNLLDFASRGFASAIFKLDLATSGRGQRRLSCTEPLDGQDLAWVEAMFRSQPLAVVEPELERVVDLSFLWHMPNHSNQPRFLGWTRPFVTAGRRYAGTKLGGSFDDCDPDLRRFLLADRCAKLQAVAQWLGPRVAAELNQRGFTGYFGVDAFVFKNAQGELKIKPLVELNPRMTMGHIALGLKKHLAPAVSAEFRIFTKSQWNTVEAKLKDVPLIRHAKTSVNVVSNRLRSGVVWFGEVDDSTKLIPCLLVGDEAMVAGAIEN